MYKETLSIIVPVFNEDEFIGTVLQRILRQPFPENLSREIIVVDDGSNDDSARVVEEFIKSHPGIRCRIYYHQHNLGKGAAIRTGIAHANGEYTLIQDADLEYDPKDYPRLLKPLLEGRADAVYGSRFVVSGERRVLLFWHALANGILTTICNLVSDLNLTDMETGFKAFRTPLLKSIPLRSQRFGFEPEITIKLAQRQARIYEVPISYHGRTYEEGKKIRFSDAVAALLTIIRFSLVRDLYTDPGSAILDSFSQAPRFNRWMADTIRPFIGKRVLEIGAGIGNLSRQLVARRSLYMATDIEPEHLSRLQARFLHRPNLQVRLCDLESRGDFESLRQGFDTVICLNVLEHVPDALQALSNINHALTVGGKAIILVPHSAHLFGTLDTALGHYCRYSKRELIVRLEAAGFHVETLIEFNRISAPAWFVTGRILRKKEIGYRQLKTFDAFTGLWRHIDPLLPWLSTSLIAIAVKEREAPVGTSPSTGHQASGLSPTGGSPGLLASTRN